MHLIEWVQNSKLVVLSLDSNIFIHRTWWDNGNGTYEAYYGNWRDVETKLRETCSFFVPKGVVDELENLKKRGQGDVRRRASDALKFIRSKNRSPSWTFQLINEYTPYTILYPGLRRSVDNTQVHKRGIA
jgi:hypothetical protein